jgi:hypothetical protein
MKKVKKSFISRLKTIIGPRFKKVKLAFARENPKDKDVDLFNPEGEYITTVDPNELPSNFKEFTEEVETQEYVDYILKRNRTRLTIRPKNETQWNFLPYLGFSKLRTFLETIGVAGDITEIISDIIRGDIVEIKIPVSQVPILRAKYIQNASINPYNKPFKESNTEYIKRKNKALWGN